MTCCRLGWLLSWCTWQFPRTCAAMKQNQRNHLWARDVARALRYLQKSQKDFFISWFSGVRKKTQIYWTQMSRRMRVYLLHLLWMQLHLLLLAYICLHLLAFTYLYDFSANWPIERWHDTAGTMPTRRRSSSIDSLAQSYQCECK